ncbi:MAG TPA: 3-hydroxyacyl-CoA dehydrogenase NAD-binding domain-containing protein [Gammaproteobacteria bacterium]|nr:3-hydroxyacyl-CoA dehydrogenase NAD-binding domain-containing protein [Gammaproteobacteria bacterium]
MTETDAAREHHWRVTYGSTGHCWLTLDKAESGSNTLSSGVMAELDAIVDRLEREPDLPGVVIRSAKHSGFILGADVREFEGLEDPVAAGQLAANGQGLFQRIEDLPCPTVAVLNGFALGGGLELALACRYRVAVEGYERCIGLPEVQLGIHPGFGGTVRTVRLLGPLKALDLMLTGRSLSPVEALRAGLVDRIAPEGDEAAAALKLLRRSLPPRRPPWHLRLLNAERLRPFVARKVRRQTRRKARPEHYPAPHAIVDLWERYGGEGADAYRAEAESIGRLLVSPTSKNLVRLFLLRERLRNLAPKSAAVSRVHVVGAGVMGGDIAAWCALKGLNVTMQDREEKYLKPAFERAKELFGKRLKGPGAAAAASRRLVGDVPGDGIPDSDVVIEAIIEDLDAKRSLFSDIEARAGSTTILATNTSSIRIETIASALKKPSRLVGVHFFNPVASMPLVEVIRADKTDPDVVDRALAFVTQIGKLPLPCASAPGFLVNRILLPYMLEALTAHEDGHALETVDAAAKRFGMPMGPVELADRVGLDTALHVAGIMAEPLGVEPPEVLHEMVDAGRLGVKSSAGGFYRYEKGRPVRSTASPEPDEELIDRLILRLVNEAAACFSDGVVEDLDLLDAGVVFGTGFAPFTGGPIQYARSRGRADIIERLERLESTFGPRFHPHPAWAEILAEE